MRAPPQSTAVGSDDPWLVYPVALFCFSVLLTTSLLGGLASDSIAFFRTHATAWSMTLMASVAMYFFVSRFRRGSPGPWWLAFCLFGWFINVVHFYYGLFHLHDGEPVTVFQRQGFLLAFSIFFFLAVWGLDAIAAVTRSVQPSGWVARVAPPYGWFDIFAFLVGFVTFFISTVIFQNDATSFWVGLVMTGAVIAGVIVRMLPRHEVA
jgi:hypothetical protein